MRDIRFTEADLAQIRHDRARHPHPRVQQRMNVLWLKAQGLGHDDIAAFADVSVRTVGRFLGEYLEGGLQRVRRVPWKGKACALDAHAASLEEHFGANPARSASEAQADIERLTGIKRSLTQVREFLKKKSGWPGARSARSRRRPTTSGRRSS